MEIIGHRSILKFLNLSLANRRLAQAYLFYGPQNIGKELVALQFASHILTDHLDLAAKKTAQNQIQQKIYPDLSWLERLEDKKNITVEQIRDLRTNLSLKSFAKSFRVVIINNADDLSEGAANSFLKFLEEAPPQTIIILLVHNLKNILPTIVSRCQLIKFNPVPLKEIQRFLSVNFRLNLNQTRIFSQLSCGRPGLVIKFLINRPGSENYQSQIKEFLDAISGTLQDKINFVSKLNQPKFFIWQIALRDLLLKKNNLPIINSDLNKSIEKISSTWSEEKIYHAIKIFGRIEKLFKFNLNKKLALENLLINL